MSENKESPDMETLWVDSIAVAKADLATGVQREQAQSRNGYSLGGVPCQVTNMPVEFPLTPPLPSAYMITRF
jgi:hypothetical protein